MKNLLIILFLISTSSHTYSQKTNEAYIKGTIINFTEKTIQVGDTTLSISEKGEFSYKIKTDFPTFYKVSYKYSNWTIYVEPGKTTDLNITIGDNSSINFIGDLKSSNNYLQKIGSINNSTYEYYDQNWVRMHSMGESGYISIIDSLKDLFINPLINLSKNDKSISSVFIKLIKTDVDYEFNSLILKYPERHLIFTREKTFLSQAVLKSLNSANVANIQYFKLSNYKMFCKELINYKADILINESTVSKHYNLKKMDAVFELLPMMFKNQTLLDFWLAEYLYQHIENNGLANSENYIKEFNLRCKTMIYKTRISDLCNSITNGEKDHLVKTYKTVNGFILKAHIFYPENMVKGERRPAIVIFHGGGWNGGNPSWAFEKTKHYRDLGMIAIAAQYRLSNREDITAIEAMSDARDLIKWMRLKSDSLGISPDSIVACGWSAGAHLAASTAIFSDSLNINHINSIPNALILESPAISLMTPDKGKEWEYAVFGPDISVSSANPVEHIHAGLPPTIILQGRDDTVTPLEGAQSFHDKSIANGNYCEIWIYDKVGHLFTPNYLDDSGWPQPDKEIQKQADTKADEFLIKFGYIKK
jgi:acetyl esterase